MIFEQQLSKKLSKLIPYISWQTINHEKIISILPNYLPLTINFFKKHISLQYKILSCISGIDFLGKDFRFCVSYDLLSILYTDRFRIKTFINEITTIPSICNIYSSANWWEREVWDMYGIFFEKHPDLRRILSDYGFEGFPMRKDFPLYGYIELRYDEKSKRIISEPVELAQDFRFFDFETPW